MNLEEANIKIMETVECTFITNEARSTTFITEYVTMEISTVVPVGEQKPKTTLPVSDAAAMIRATIESVVPTILPRNTRGATVGFFNDVARIAISIMERLPIRFSGMPETSQVSVHAREIGSDYIILARNELMMLISVRGHAGDEQDQFAAEFAEKH